MPDFDTLNNQHLNEGVRHLHWLTSQGKYHKLLTSDRQTVKLWKIHEITERIVLEEQTEGDELKLPVIEQY